MKTFATTATNANTINDLNGPGYQTGFSFNTPDLEAVLRLLVERVIKASLLEFFHLIILQQQLGLQVALQICANDMKKYTYYKKFEIAPLISILAMGILSTGLYFVGKPNLAIISTFMGLLGGLIGFYLHISGYDKFDVPRHEEAKNFNSEVKGKVDWISKGQSVVVRVIVEIDNEKIAFVDRFRRWDDAFSANLNDDVLIKYDSDDLNNFCIFFTKCS